MNKCLVTKYRDTVNNTDLLRVGEMRISYSKVSNPTAKTQGMALQFAKETKLEIIGDGYFTDSTLTNNLGKTLIIPASNADVNAFTNVFSSNGDYDIAILDKYSLVNIKLNAEGFSALHSEMSNKMVCIDDLVYSHKLRIAELFSQKTCGNIAALANLTKLSYFNASDSSVYGNLNRVKNLTNLTVLGLENTQVSGDISALANLTALASFNIANTQVSGDVSALANLTALASFNIVNTQVSGDVSALANLTALTSLETTGLSGNIEVLSKMSKLKTTILKRGNFTGDLAKIPSSCYFISFSYSNSNLTWSTRPTSANIIAIESAPKVANIDKMLQDQANCVKAIPSSVYSYYKTISATGTRTSASDDAVATLQNKGYTVSVTPA